MKIKHFKYQKVLPILCFVLSNIMFSQEFKHIETVSGLAGATKNNGVSVADYDGDNDLDIFIVSLNPEEDDKPSTYSRLYRNDNNGGFTDVSEEAGLLNQYKLEETTGFNELFGLDGYKFGAYWGDYDNDGYPDLFLTHLRKSQLFHNEGDGTFQDVTSTSGISVDRTCNIAGATWVDYDNDSFLDLFLADWDGCNGNLLYKNNGNGTFEDVTAISKIGEGESLSSYTMSPFDFNNDGFLDFYISNDFEKSNALLINQAGSTFIEQASNFGMDSMLDDMGIAIGDVNNDGAFDFFTTGINENSMLLNDGNNNFTESSSAFGLLHTDWAWGCTFADFDLDGDEDLFVANGFYISGPQRNVYYKNLLDEGGTGFQNVSSDLKVDDEIVSVETLDFDYDNDGDLDLFVTNAATTSFFYENKVNDTNEATNRNWLKILLEGTTSNRDAYGTKIKITTNSGSSVRYYNGVGFLSQSIKPVHFGLNNDVLISELVVNWPSGLEEIYTNIDANNHIKLIEGVGLEVLSQAPSSKVVGCADPSACNYNPLATSADNSCVFLQPKEITGNTASGFDTIEDYTYGSETNTKVIWSVSGGEIIEGQGTNSIQVKWGLGAIGNVTAIEIGEICKGDSETINVVLDIKDVAPHISVARIWNEVLLEAIRNDFARPTVHARNLFHTSVALYDAWAVYDFLASPYLVGNNVNGFKSELEPFYRIEPQDIGLTQQQAMSYAVYRLLKYRFKDSPNAEETLALFDLIMDQLGYDINLMDTNYKQGKAYAMGNYIAEQIINYGKTDGSREETHYDNAFYKPVNSPLILNVLEESEELKDPNRWQPLTFEAFRDQSGNLIADNTPSFLSPEWGGVLPFSLQERNTTIFNRDNFDYKVYHDPGAPPYLNINKKTKDSELYKWNFTLVSIWGSHLDPSDGVMWDISPKAKGNVDINSLPIDFGDYASFYKRIEGGDISKGRAINPETNKPYEPQIVPRGDYTRVLAEFWADGPDSETPPGHWFTILNGVGDHEALERKFEGKGKALSRLEWDIKSYFILGGAMHDAAITAWSIKGWYDYIRPISAIRYLSSIGQSTNPGLLNYNIVGIPLEPGYIEVVGENDLLSGLNNENVGKIKLYTWNGPNKISDPTTDVAGVGWVLAENWFPYQRPSFVTPPFAGYLSGHSTYSRAAAEVLTLITGDEYFPGGLGEFLAKKDEFLTFEKGPSVDVKLQWATYRDASDQTSLSRIWGGIHPPADDILGRIVGKRIGFEAYNYAIPYFDGDNPDIDESIEPLIYPNPVITGEFNINNLLIGDKVELYDINGRSINISRLEYDKAKRIGFFKVSNALAKGVYILRVRGHSSLISIK
ncbi:FG-GAP-like repeat-containing protein [Algibacter sp. 2305UL17-15]|uniref:FG-GAP-like repeat-containing protein n=1 Tax=Algibacter sp. 2305UL17-15 TaxID=3231268 RepID=UPI003457447F